MQATSMMWLPLEEQIGSPPKPIVGSSSVLLPVAASGGVDSTSSANAHVVWYNIYVDMG